MKKKKISLWIFIAYDILLYHLNRLKTTAHTQIIPQLRKSIEIKTNNDTL